MYAAGKIAYLRHSSFKITSLTETDNYNEQSSISSFVVDTVLAGRNIIHLVIDDHYKAPQPTSVWSGVIWQEDHGLPNDYTTQIFYNSRDYNYFGSKCIEDYFTFAPKPNPNQNPKYVLLKLQDTNEVFQTAKSFTWPTASLSLKTGMSLPTAGQCLDYKIQGVLGAVIVSKTIDPIDGLVMFDQGIGDGHYFTPFFEQSSDNQESVSSFVAASQIITIKRFRTQRISVFSRLAWKPNENNDAESTADWPIFLHIGPFFDYPACSPFCTDFEQIGNQYKELGPIQGRIYRMSDGNYYISKDNRALNTLKDHKLGIDQSSNIQQLQECPENYCTNGERLTFVGNLKRQFKQDERIYIQQLKSSFIKEHANTNYLEYHAKDLYFGEENGDFTLDVPLSYGDLSSQIIHSKDSNSFKVRMYKSIPNGFLLLALKVYRQDCVVVPTKQEFVDQKWPMTDDDFNNAFIPFKIVSCLKPLEMRQSLPEYQKVEIKQIIEQFILDISDLFKDEYCKSNYVLKTQSKQSNLWIEGQTLKLNRQSQLPQTIKFWVEAERISDQSVVKTGIYQIDLALGCVALRTVIDQPMNLEIINNDGNFQIFSYQMIKAMFNLPDESICPLKQFQVIGNSTSTYIKFEEDLVSGIQVLTQQSDFNYTFGIKVASFSGWTATKQIILMYIGSTFEGVKIQINVTATNSSTDSVIQEAKVVKENETELDKAMKALGKFHSIESISSWLEKRNDQNPVKFVVKQVTPRGKVLLTFNQEMLPIRNMTRYEELFEFEVISVLDQSVSKGSYKINSMRRLLQDDNKLVYFKFNWTVSHNDSKKIEFKLDFEIPEQVSSTNFGMDELRIVFLDPEAFISKNFSRLTQEEALKKDLIFEIPQQSQYDDSVMDAVEKSAEFGASLFNFATSGSFIVNLVLSTSLASLIGMVRHIKLIVFLNLVNLVMPAHTLVFMKVLMNMVSLDIFDISIFYEENFNLKETDPLTPKFILLGVETQNFLINTGSYLFWQTLIVAVPLLKFFVNKICLQLRSYQFFRRTGIRFFQKDIKGGIIYASAKLFLESFLDMALASLLSISCFIHTESIGSLFETPQDAVSSVLAIICAFLVLSLPIYVIIIIIRNFDNLDSDAFKDSLEGLFTEYIFTNRYSRALYHSFFLLRRVFIIMIFVYLHKHSFFQVQLLMTLSMLNLSYMLSERPMDTVRENRIEIFNEFCYLIVVYLFNIYLNQAIDQTFKNIVGWVIIFVTSLTLIVNIGIQFLQSLRQFYYKSILCFKQRKITSKMAHSIKNKQNLVCLYPDQFKEMKEEIEINKALMFCKDWSRERQWLIKNRVDVSSFIEECKYAEYNKKFKFLEKVKVLKTTKIIKEVSKSEAKKQVAHVKTKFRKSKSLIEKAKAIMMKSALPKITEVEEIESEDQFIRKRAEQIENNIIKKDKKFIELKTKKISSGYDSKKELQMFKAQSGESDAINNIIEEELGNEEDHGFIDMLEMMGQSGESDSELRKAIQESARGQFESEVVIKSELDRFSEESKKSAKSQQESESNIQSEKASVIEESNSKTSSIDASSYYSSSSEKSCNNGYVKSVINVLMSLDEMKQFYLNKDYKRDNKSQPFSKMIEELYIFGGHHFVIMQNFHQVALKQQDPAEFLSKLLRILCQEQKSDQQSVHVNDWFSDFWHILTQDEIKCLEHGKVLSSQACVNNNILVFPHFFDEDILSFFETKTIEAPKFCQRGINACSQAIKEVQVSQLPKMLVVHVMIFDSNGKMIDSEMMKAQSEIMIGDSLYELYSLVIFEDQPDADINDGQFTSFVKKDQLWYKFDSTEVEEEQVLRDCYPIIMFYALQ